jgi:hypothetical protein
MCSLAARLLLSTWPAPAPVSLACC